MTPDVIQTILLLVAVGCFLIAAIASLVGGELGRFNAIAWGLAAFAAAFLVG
jgi:predicted cobalt transporter CbtA